MLGTRLPAKPVALSTGWGDTNDSRINALDTFKLDQIFLQPPVGSSIPTFGVSVVANAAPVIGTPYFVPIVVPYAMTADALNVYLGTVYSGTNIPTVNMALYASDPATGYPLTTGGTVATAKSLSGVAVGVVSMAFSAATVIQPGLYWAAFLLTGSASTAGAFSCISTSNFPYPVATSLGTGGFAIQPRGLASGTAQTALPTAAIASSAFTGVQTAVAPMAWLHRSA